MSNKQQHYHLISALILYVPKDANGEVGYAPVPVNAVLTTFKRELTRHDIGRAQQAAQMTLFSQLEEQAVNIQVLNVVITGIVHMGLMTQEEYEAKPEPVLQSVKTEEVFG